MASLRASPSTDEYSSAERRLLARLRTPMHIQRFMDDELTYSCEIGGATCRAV
jgi:hypothetical protein